jgi:hypothetical protein
MIGSSPARSKMKMRCAIERNFSVTDAAEDKDGFGQKLQDWRELHPSLPCHCWAGASGGKHTGAAEFRTVTTDMPGMIIPLGTDVRATDRVAWVKDRLGNDLFPAMRIDAVMPRITHLELRLLEIG